MARRSIPSTTKKQARESGVATQRFGGRVLVSGGIDSAALLVFYLRHRFKARALFVDAR